MYLVAEFLHMVLAAFLIVILFLGGWHFWRLSGSSDQITWPIAVLRIIVLLVKVMGVILFFMLARWSWPRFRFDQLMELAWKVMIPWGMINLLVVAVWMEYGEPLARLVALPNGSCLAAIAWGVLLLVWLITVAIDPTYSDNRPRRRVRP
jgi:NADH-quinone oxidoreductase subunit H